MTRKPRKITPERLATSKTEDGEQAALFCHAHEMAKTNIRWDFLFAIPNGGKRGVATASRLVATGVKRGIPDICLPLPINRFHGLYIELKKLAALSATNGGVDDAQKFWHARLREQGYAVSVCYGWVHAADVIERYLQGVLK
jgi:hypothetical protein